MTNAAALVHVVRYDARRMQWWWLAYAALLAAAATSPVVFREMPVGQYEPLWGYPALLLPLLGVLFGLALGQGDGGFDVRAFLRAKPVSDSTRAAARLVHVLAVAMLTGLVIMAGLLYTGMGTGDSFSLAAGTIAPYLLLLLCGTNLGAHARKLATGLLLLLGATLLLFPAGSLGIDLKQLTASKSALAIVAVGMTWLIYTRRVPMRVTMVVSLALFTLSFGGWCSDTVGPSARATYVTTPIPERIRFGALPDTIGARTVVPFTIEGARGDRLYYVSRADIMPFGRPVGLSDTERPVLIGSGKELFARAGETPRTVFPGLEGLEWSPPLSAADTNPAARGVVAGDMRADASLRDISEITLSGTVRRFRAEPVVKTRLSTGRWYSGAGQSVALLEDRGRPVLEVRRTRADLARFDSDRDDPSVRFDVVVIDSTTRTAYLLQSSNVTGTDAPYVLPTLGFSITRTQFQQEAVVRTLLRPGARASVVVYRWVEEGQSETRDSRPVARWPISPNSNEQAAASIRFRGAR